MPYKKVSYFNFRNIQNTTLSFDSKQVFLVGENGQGKTNLLESLYYTAYGTSFRTHKDTELAKNGQKDFSINAQYHTEDINYNIFCCFESGKKKIEKDNKRILDRKDLINTIPTVLFCHSDMNFAIGEPELRRFFIDQCLCMYDNIYIDTLRNYKKVLKTRNLILKEKKYSLLDVIDIQLVQYGLELQKKRQNAIDKFNLVFSTLYQKASGVGGVSILYAPSWHASDFNEQKILSFLQEKAQIDKTLCVTMTGPHRDKIYFIKEGQNFINKASTGQQRMVSLILRIAQAVFFTQITNKKPVLLMDDVLLELDLKKRENFSFLLPEYDQVFCTFLLGEQYQRYAKEDTAVFFIKDGSCTLQK